MFHNYRRNYDGKASWCKQCVSKAAKANNSWLSTFLSEVVLDDLPVGLSDVNVIFFLSGLDRVLGTGVVHRAKLH